MALRQRSGVTISQVHLCLHAKQHIASGQLATVHANNFILRGENENENVLFQNMNSRKVLFVDSHV